MLIKHVSDKAGKKKTEADKRRKNAELLKADRKICRSLIYQSNTVMRILVLFAVFLLVSGFAGANNIKVNGEARVVDFVGSGHDTAIVEFGISWENSWRDDFNWDAAWIFLKYKKRGLTSEWHHAYLCREGHEVQPQGGDTGGYTFISGEVGQDADAKITGLFLMRDGLSEGNVNTRVRVKWPLQGNSRLPLTEEDFGENRDSIFMAAYAVEMVYVPLGSYYLGDREMTGAFYKNPAGPIPASKDIVDNNSGYTITAKHNYYPAYHAADRINNPNYSSTYTWYTYATEPSWWKIDFKTPRMIRYFGVSGSISYPDHRPGGTWYLEGSDNDTDWTPLWEGPPEEWVANATSYPVQHSIRVTNPGLYRYYRINIPNNAYAMAQNIAMTESDLYADGYELCIDGEEALDLGTYFLANDGQVWSGSLPASYPKGYRGYYCMKYEVSQEQYVEFLNSLTLAQQKNRVANNDFNNMVKGDYAFGDLKHPNCRNGIAFIMTKGAGTPAVFGNNLNPGNKFYSEDDGQTLACNYLSPADMLAYCDWSGLRPMSELEYEKACRRPYPQLPDRGELAWNSGSGVRRIGSEGDLTGVYTERETPFDYRVNVNSGGRINGPVRSGAFATSRTGQVEAGATYWGLMEMSGNVWEMCYSANAAGRSFVGDNAGSSHGDGYLNSDGTTDIGASYWPNVVGALAVRGGSFAGADSLLRTSDRTYATGNYFSVLTQRDSTVGFRGVRSVLNTSGFTAGRIYSENGTETDTVCSGAGFMIQGEPAGKAVGKVTYTWYVSEDEGSSWTFVEDVTTENLLQEGKNNPGKEVKRLQFKRKAVCAVGEEVSNVVEVVISPAVGEVPCIRSQYYTAMGASLSMSCYEKAGDLQFLWESPTGHLLQGDQVNLSSVRAGDLGQYTVRYINEYGCQGQAAATQLFNSDKIVIVQHADGYRMWSNGTFAATADEYRHPSPPYYYEGTVGDGIYRIQPEECNRPEPVDVYCDMTTGEGGWVLAYTTQRMPADPRTNLPIGGERKNIYPEPNRRFLTSNVPPLHMSTYTILANAKRLLWVAKDLRDNTVKWWETDVPSNMLNNTQQTYQAVTCYAQSDNASLTPTYYIEGSSNYPNLAYFSLLVGTMSCNSSPAVWGGCCYSVSDGNSPTGMAMTNYSMDGTYLTADYFQYWLYSK